MGVKDETIRLTLTRTELLSVLMGEENSSLHAKVQVALIKSGEDLMVYFRKVIEAAADE